MAFISGIARTCAFFAPRPAPENLGHLGASWINWGKSKHARHRKVHGERMSERWSVLNVVRI
eukprot:1085729-Pyramimonas_sp.AAC.1